MYATAPWPVPGPPFIEPSPFALMISWGSCTPIDWSTPQMRNLQGGLELLAAIPADGCALIVVLVLGCALVLSGTAVSSTSSMPVWSHAHWGSRTIFARASSSRMARATVWRKREGAKARERRPATVGRRHRAERYSVAAERGHRTHRPGARRGGRRDHSARATPPLYNSGPGGRASSCVVVGAGRRTAR